MDTDLSWVPGLDCPLPSRISPHVDVAGQDLPAWVQRFGLLPGEAARKRLVQGRFAHYAGRLYPDADPADLCCLASIFTWFFLLDDACDGANGPRPALVAALRDDVLGLLAGNKPPRTGTPTGALLRMLAEAWQLPSRRMAARWRERFVDAVAHYLDGVLVETSNKTTGHRPTVAEYVTLRRATSAAYVSYVLIEFATGQPVPDAIYHHPAVQRVADAGNDLLSWFNDLLSLDRDRASSGGHNLVLALARERGMTLPAATRAVVRRWRDRMRQFGQLRAAVPSFGPPIDEPLRHYLDGVAYSVRGTIDWSLESGRYRNSGPLALLRLGDDDHDASR